MACDEVRIWHYPCKTETPRFFYWLTAEPENQEGYGFDTLDGMIEAAYAHIDPMAKSLPEACPIPEQARITDGS